MARYSLYLDVAGHPNSQIYCAGCFISTEAGWLRFEPDWKEALERNSLRSGLHMTDFEYGHRDDPNNPRKWDTLRDLIDVAAKHLLASFSHTLDMDVYRRVNERVPLEEVIGKPYGFAARSAARLAERWQIATRNVGELLVFVESGTLHQGDMLECFARDSRREPTSVPKSHPAAQIADLYAWERAYFKRTSLVRPSLAYLKERFREPARGIDSHSMTKRSLMKSWNSLNLPYRTDIGPEVKFSFRSSPKKARKKTI